MTNISVKDSMSITNRYKARSRVFAEMMCTSLCWLKLSIAAQLCENGIFKSVHYLYDLEATRGYLSLA